MILIIKYLLEILIGFGSGIFIAGGIFAFIAVIGVIPRIAQKTKTIDKIILYEEMIILGGFIGSLVDIFYIHIPIGFFGAVLVGFFVGIFYGCMAMSLAEVLDVIPILERRISLGTGIKHLVLFIAIGKLSGSIMYFLIPGFLHYS